MALYNWAMYGILLGTNSFIIPSPGRFLPSLTTLFYGSGTYEITAYTLISSFSKQKIVGKHIDMHMFLSSLFASETGESNLNAKSTSNID